MTRRSLLTLAAAAPALTSGPLQSELSHSASLLGLPGFIAGIVQNGKLSAVHTEGFADLESRTPMRQDHIFYVASLTKTFTAVMLMQYVQEKKISLEDYVLDYPFLSVGLSLDRLLDPNVKLKHILSHTSEGAPGDHYLYNGNRFNFLYGVFEKMSGNTQHYHACAQEFRQRIQQPLGLSSTLPGYPTDKNDPRISRITTPYFLDSSHTTAAKDRGAAGSTTMYPATGMLSSVDDLARYMIALDDNTLLTAESYARLTAPYALNDGRLSTYGLGWSTQNIGGHSVHWHYGYGDSYSALLVRLPQKKTSFIFLSNTGAASAPFLLGYGNLLTSPFAVAFLHSALPGVLTSADMDFAKIFLLHYAETALHRNPGEVKALLKKLTSTAPARFKQSDWATITLLSKLSDTAFSSAMNNSIEAYQTTRAFHPDISLAIADYYENTQQPAKRDHFLKNIADRPGYGEQKSTRDACLKLGAELLRTGKTEEGRKYIWRAAQYAKTAGANTEAQEKMVQRLKL